MKEKPQWLEWCERVPPMENHNLFFQAKTIRNPYGQMLNFLLKKYPDLRFQDCYVDGNDWSVGNDTYRADHPAMQFVARQLDLMRSQGLGKREAFAKTEEWFRERRDRLEQEQKVQMAMALGEGFVPMFSTGQAYLKEQIANNEAAHMQKILQELRRDRKAHFHFLEGDLVYCRPEGKEDAPAELCEVVTYEQGLLTVRQRKAAEGTTPWVRTLGMDQFSELRVPKKDRLGWEETNRLGKADAVRRDGVPQEQAAETSSPASDAVQQAMKGSEEDEEDAALDKEAAGDQKATSPKSATEKKAEPSPSQEATPAPKDTTEAKFNDLVQVQPRRAEDPDDSGYVVRSRQLVRKVTEMAGLDKPLPSPRDDDAMPLQGEFADDGGGSAAQRKTLKESTPVRGKGLGKGRRPGGGGFDGDE